MHNRIPDPIKCELNQLKAEIESQKAIFEIQQQEKMENIKE